VKYTVRIEARIVTVGYITVTAEDVSEALRMARADAPLAQWSQHGFDKEFATELEIVEEKE
jgi:hypothetical protein